MRAAALTLRHGFAFGPERLRLNHVDSLRQVHRALSIGRDVEATTLNQSKDHRMQCSPGNARRAAAATVVALAWLTTSAAAVEPQADLVFDALGPAACEMPPPSFDAPIAMGELSGGMTSSFAGGGLYGSDEAGGFVVGVQGMLFDDAPELTMLCMVLVRLGASEETAGSVVGENGIDDAADGTFLGVFKLVRHGAGGAPETFAAGAVESGSVSFGMFDCILVEGVVAVEGSYTLASDSETRPFNASITIPRAENVLRPALRLSRN
jgi:hypothetical protein